jgi:hypothetical protein
MVVSRGDIEAIQKIENIRNVVLHFSITIEIERTIERRMGQEVHFGALVLGRNHDDLVEAGFLEAAVGEETNRQRCKGLDASRRKNGLIDIPLTERDVDDTFFQRQLL